MSRGARPLYSVAYVLVREVVETRDREDGRAVSPAGERVASHARSHEQCSHTTDLQHMAAAHQAHFAAGDEQLE